MDDLEEYVITCVSEEDLQSLYDDLETHGGSEAIPDRAVPVFRRRPLSLNTHYMLTAQEALELSQDLRVLDVKPVKFLEAGVTLHSYTQTGNFSKSPYTDAMDPSYRNWALLRCLEGVQRSGWGSDNTKNQTVTITLGPTGKNVDVIIMDGICGVPNHPEFAVNEDGSGGSRYIQYDWYQLNNIVTSLDDDGATLLSGPYSYAADSNSGDATHGAHTTGTVAGNRQGWARDANIYQIGALGQQGIGSTIVWDYVRAFHKNKPINPSTGRKNPTICNCSYGQSYTWPSTLSDGTQLFSIIQAKRRGTFTGTFGTSPYTAFTTAQLNSVGIYSNTIPFYNTASASDITQALDDGIIVVASSGNQSFYIDIPTGPDYNNYFVAGIGTNTNLQNFYYHQGTAPASVPGVICVGAVDAYAIDKKGYYSNTGPRIDVFAPGSWIVSAYANSTNIGWGSPVSDPRNSNYYIGREIGTSMAAPQVTGMLACLLEIYPDMTPAKALTYIKGYAKTSQLSDTGGTSPTWTSDTLSLQGAPNRYMYFPKERPSSGEMYPKQNHMPRPSSGILYPRNRTRLR